MRVRASLLALAVAAASGCGGGQKQAAAPVRRAPAPAPRPAESASAEEFSVTGTMGTLDQDAVDQPFQLQGGEINRCYHDGAARLWYLGGKLELKVKVKHDGAVKEVATVTPLGNLSVERCVAEIVRGMHFAHPRGGSEAEFNYSWDFQARAAVRDWGTDDASSHFEKHRKDLKECVHRGPAPSGLRVTFFVAPGGKVTSVGVGADSPVDDGYASCVAERVQTWKFDDPLGKIARATFRFQ